jgi:RNA polymerase sigma-70 factor (ECF subfamily)
VLWSWLVSSLPSAPASGGRDDEALARAAQQDPLLFSALYTSYLDAIYRYCYVRLGSHESAEDATSEVFLKAFSGLPGYRGNAGTVFAAWLFQIARNVVTDHYRRRRPNVPVELLDEQPDPADPPEEQAIAASEREAVRAALAQLPEEQRTVLELQLAGWSGEQIAGAIGRSHGAVRMLRLRAVQQLKATLAGAGTPASATTARGTRT